MRQLLVAGLLMIGSGRLVFAGLDWELQITDGPDTALVNASGALVLSGSATGTAGPTSGLYIVNLSIGNYIVNVATGEGPPLLLPGSLDLNSIDTATGSASGPLTIEWSVNGITTPLDSSIMAFGGTFSSGAGSSVSNSAYESNLNTFFAETNTIGTITPTIGAGGAFSGNASGSPAGVSAPYSLTEVVTLNGVGPTNYSGDATLNPDPPSTPEPAGVVLLSSVILAVIALRRKFIKKVRVN